MLIFLVIIFTLFPLPVNCVLSFVLWADFQSESESLVRIHQFAKSSLFGHL